MLNARCVWQVYIYIDRCVLLRRLFHYNIYIICSFLSSLYLSISLSLHSSVLFLTLIESWLVGFALRNFESTKIWQKLRHCYITTISNWLNEKREPVPTGKHYTFCAWCCSDVWLYFLAFFSSNSSYHIRKYTNIYPHKYIRIDSKTNTHEYSKFFRQKFKLQSFKSSHIHQQCIRREKGREQQQKTQESTKWRREDKQVKQNQIACQTHII